MAAVLVGSAVALAAPLLGTPESDAVRSVDAGEATRLASAPPVPDRTGRASRSRVTTPAAPRTAPTAAAAADRPPAHDLPPAHGRPVEVTIGGSFITAPVTRVGVSPSGEVAIPERIDTVGWDRWAAEPGARTGSVVLVGHVDDAVQGEGAFFRLHDVTAGTPVVLRMSDGHAYRYRVVAREEFPKTSVPLAALFSRTGRARLTLITCGGSFDRSALSYRDNIVVTAVPL